MNINSSNGKVIKFKTGVGGGANGDLAIVSSGTAIKCASGAGAVGILGIFRGDFVEGDIAEIEIYEDAQIVDAAYTGSTKTSVTDADLGKAFGVTGPTTVNLDDTTNGVAVCVGYNNTIKQVSFMIPTAKRYL